jgi:hypothetical protein
MPQIWPEVRASMEIGSPLRGSRSGKRLRINARRPCAGGGPSNGSIGHSTQVAAERPSGPCLRRGDGYLWGNGGSHMATPGDRR